MIPPPGMYGVPPPAMRGGGGGYPPQRIHRGATIAAPPTAGPAGAGPPVTVFVGNITERAQDAMIRLLLNACGPVLSWKRVQGATGKLQVHSMLLTAYANYYYTGTQGF